MEAFNVLIKTSVKFESPFESKFKTLVLSGSPSKNGSEQGGIFCEACLGHDRLFADMMMMMMLLEEFLLTLSLFDC